MAGSDTSLPIRIPHPYSNPPLEHSLSYVGREFGDSMASHYSRQQYGHALIQLNATLQHPRQASSLETLMSTVLLSFYEIHNGTDQRSWVRHAGGAAKIFQLRGAKMHEAGLGKLTLAAYRPFLVTEAMVARKSSFLNLPSWRKMLRKSAERNSKESLSSSIEKFYSGLARQSEYFEAVCVKGPTATVPTLLGLLEWGEDIRSDLRGSHTGMAMALRDMGQEPAQLESTRHDTPFRTIYRYPNSRIGSFYCGYWNALIALNGILTRLGVRLHKLADKDTTFDCATSRNLGSNLGTNTADMPSRLYDQCKNRLESIECARNICMSVEDLSTSVFLGSMNLVIALRAVLLLLDSPEEQSWIYSQLKSISKHIALAESATPHDERSANVILTPSPL